MVTTLQGSVRIPLPLKGVDDAHMHNDCVRRGSVAEAQLDENSDVVTRRE